MNLSGIWNISSTYNVNNKKISAKLSFQIGEKFSARVMQLNKSTGEILLKLLDGWQFSGELESYQNILENQLIRLEVEGFENGKLKLKIVNSEGEHNNSGNDPISLFIKENDFNLSNEDYDLIYKMVKHEIPLTKDNISNIKSVLEFMNKIKQNPEEQDIFIQKYLISKNLSPDSEEGKFTNTTLKKFFNQLKSINGDDLFTFLENNIELDENNIKSFNSIFKNKGTIYNEVKNLGQLLPKQIVQQDQSENIQLQDKAKNAEDSLKENNVGIIDKSKNQFAILQGEEDRTGLKTKLEGEKSSIGLKTNALKTAADAEENLGVQNLKSQETSKNEINIKSKTIETTGETSGMGDSGKVHPDNVLSSFVKDRIMPYVSHRGRAASENNIGQIAVQIKDQIDAKINDMKDIVREILEQKNSGKNDISENINHILNNNINDFKIFNTISNSYYYMDLPINLNQNNYQCRLMIKDERKKGKKIDSTNVKIAASISTENMGVVDTYLTVNGHNMDIDIKCNEKWLDLLSREHEKILESLSDVGYNVDVRFHEKVEEMNISTCGEFFEDKDISILNARV
ncbi:hypothetical protein ACFHWD_04715 [Clostridium sp. MT-14]|uniref:Flagellar hook-length control protein FliK n=1 Tax=Clostridium aromativorans TaxID=2836848 RepID=A0ABS8N4A6_9CLOT|nr:hypothetical protein [Clostridium aromativorans]MCC9293628.1 hypothetical protein [Clostridium aromativorans]